MTEVAPKPGQNGHIAQRSDHKMRTVDTSFLFSQSLYSRKGKSETQSSEDKRTAARSDNCFFSSRHLSSPVLIVLSISPSTFIPSLTLCSLHHCNTHNGFSPCISFLPPAALRYCFIIRLSHSPRVEDKRFAAIPTIRLGPALYKDISSLSSEGVKTWVLMLRDPACTSHATSRVTLLALTFYGRGARSSKATVQPIPQWPQSVWTSGESESVIHSEWNGRSNDWRFGWLSSNFSSVAGSQAP